MIIRELTRQDLPSLRVIAELAVVQTVDAPTSEKSAILDGIFRNLNLAAAGGSAGVFLVAEHDHQSLGFILIKNHWNLSDLFIHPEHQARGIATQLWRTALPLCRPELTESRIRVNSSLNAVTFYEGIGFKRIETPSDLPPWVLPLELKF